MKHHMCGLGLLFVFAASVATVVAVDRPNDRVLERNLKSSKKAAMKENTSDAFESMVEDRCRLRGRMQSGAMHLLASGEGKFEKRNNRLKLSVEVEDLAAEFIGTSASINVGGDDLGTIEIVCINPLAMPACTLGGFDLNLDSDNGDIVPDLVGMDDCADVSVMFTVTDLNADMIGSGTMILKDAEDAGDPGDPGDPDPDDDDRCRLEGELDSSMTHPLASGKGKFEKRNARLRTSVEIEDVAASFIGTIATITVAGEVIGMEEILCINPPTCTFGGFDLNLDTLNGDTVTDIVGMQECGQVSVEVTVNDINGDVIVSGTMIEK